MTRGRPRPHSPTAPVGGAAPAAGRDLPPARQKTVVGASPTGILPRQKVSDQGEAMAAALTHQRSGQTIRQTRYSGRRLAQVSQSEGPADGNRQPPVVGQPAGALEPRSPSFVPSPLAPSLPVTALGSDVRAILQRAAPDCAALLFEHFNRLTNVARYAESNELYAEAVEASNVAGRLAVKIIEMTVGKQLNIKAEITGQSSIPKWDQLPKEAQDYYKRMSAELAKLPEPTAKVIDVTQLDGEPIGGGYGYTTEGA